MLLTTFVVLALSIGAANAETGMASWYGPGFHGRTTANGERFDRSAATCAHKHLHFNTRVRVTVLATGRSAVCRINDRGPYAGGRIIDVSEGMARRLGFHRQGTARVRLEVVGK